MRDFRGCAMTFARRAAVSAALSVFAGPGLAGEVDLAAAGCPDLPGADVGFAIMLVLHEDGTAEDCRIISKPHSVCSLDAYDPREGFLCIDFTIDPRPDGTHAETTLSKTTKSMTVDGIRVPERYGYSYWNYHKDFGTGPSGENYEVVVEHEVGSRLFTVVLDVTGKPDTSIEVHSVSITYDE